MKKTGNAMIFHAVALLGFCVLLCGILYPVGIAFTARVLFPSRSTGTLLYRDCACAGSMLLAQQCCDPRFFASRPSSAVDPSSGSGGSNLGPFSSVLRDSIERRTSFWMRNVPGSKRDVVPPDLLTASGSGFDPHISLDAALFQLPRVVAARGYSQEQEIRLRGIIRKIAEDGAASASGKMMVNVLELNLILDAGKKSQVQP